ncbi:MAG TPA: SDR family NAD(P)-dependent oxidoreductase [Polyangia bacterium]|nr:SDR family NAD(P)-dependent oxidoreductase [Polyangia bacterium]
MTASAERPRPLLGRVAWVTGSSRGIGRVVADHLASLGAAVVVHGTSAHSTRAFGEAESLAAVAEAIAQANGVDVLPVFGDLGDEGRVAALVSSIHARFGRVDILVNCAGGDVGTLGVTAPNAGSPAHNDALNISVADLRVVLERNLITHVLPCRAIAPQMMARRSGWIVNIGSIAGLRGADSEATYRTAKAAVHEYTRCLAAQLRPYNVYVNAVAPGGVITPRFVVRRGVTEQQKVKDGTLDRYGWPLEIAHAVAFLATGASSFISGQILRVDGGGQLWPA